MARRPRRKLVWVYGLVMVAGIVAFAGGCAGRSDLTAPGSGGSRQISDSGSYERLVDPPASAERVTVGLYAVNVFDIDLMSNTFFLNGYLWVRWSGERDPNVDLEFANAVHDWDFTREPLTDRPTILANGDKLQQYRIEGQFFEPFNLGAYPLDRQQLTVWIESTTGTADQIVFLPDRSQSGLGAGMSVPGWQVEGLTTEPLVHSYATNFGDPALGDATRYSALRFSVELERSHNLFIWKLMLPLVLVLATNWLTLLLHPHLVEVRTALPPTALLATVFLQQSSMTAIPEVSELVLMDMLYGLAFGLIVLTFVQIVFDNSRLRHEDPGEAESVRRWDRLSLAVQVAAFAAALPTILILQT